ncbi:hypothetical protein BDS110ZK12_27630 [Bradyrhizobium diazoefficiens]|uniref:Uncharacterized protein n=1 Tax=Bradyrhizobium diazoefficiens TaxID=1355477 RepID=A0A810BMI1_9BRAD|nr:hypothetical protein XF8B_65920 [Bradyrhizobium diazoefficiens]BCF37579.1 hypothetical protein XF15B_66500 [Bradyrhizobium diazoefficiens]BCF46257.1 hypothetical protein XF16B_67470 [Bradyrhizobium diazoefficiens]BCF72410.1 hypothetical protein XF19B_67630 [Bradyrhizobium diazoefficiens]
MDRGIPEQVPQVPARVIKVRSCIYDNRLVANGEPNGKRVRMTMRSDRQIADRSVIEREYDGIFLLASDDRIAPVRK